MSSNPLMMGYGGGDLLRTGTVWSAVHGAATQACVCRLWGVACVASGSGARARDESALEVAPPA